MNTNTIGYYLMPNPTDTAEKAPYLPKLVPNGVANLNDVAAKVAESLPVSEERAKLLIRENFTESLKMALIGYTVDMGALRMKARIPGSMPCEDTPFDPETNACVIELYADGELSDAFDELVPVELTATQLANAIKVSNVMDVETEDMGEIHGSEPFMILGNGVTLDAPGESAKLVDKKTQAELATAEVESVSKGQRATCKFAAVAGGIAKGQYWLVVTTFGLIGETMPRVFRKPVTLVEAIPAPPEPIAKSEDGITKVMTFVDAETGADRVITGMNDFVLDGEGLELAEDGGDGVTGVRFFGPGLEDYLDLTEGARNDGSKLIAGVGSYVDALEPGDHECHLGLYLKHGEATDLNVWIDFALRKE